MNLIAQPLPPKRRRTSHQDTRSKNHFYYVQLYFSLFSFPTLKLPQTFCYLFKFILYFSALFSSRALTFMLSLSSLFIQQQGKRRTHKISFRHSNSCFFSDSITFHLSATLEVNSLSFNAADPVKLNVQRHRHEKHERVFSFCFFFSVLFLEKHHRRE